LLAEKVSKSQFHIYITAVLRPALHFEDSIIIFL